jgi:glycosyltransferase involved in cell wall biosynthesis
MKVYYIGSGLPGCYTVRCLLPLIANGWDGDKTSLSGTEISPEKKTQAVKNADIVVFHRPETADKLEMAKMLKSIGKKIVFDNDDTYKDVNGFKPNEFLDQKRMERGLKKLNEGVDEFVQFADLVTCSTDFLKKEYEQLNPNVVVIPNCIDPFYFDETLKNDTDVVRIGIVGSIAVTGDLEVLKPIIEHYRGRTDVKLVLFSLPPNKEDKLMREMYYDEYKFFDTLDFIEWQPFVGIDEYYDTLNELKLDLMIIPRLDTYFNRCKSNLKFLEASMFEIPVIAQGFTTGDSPYQGKDEEYMKIVVDNKDWIPTIEETIKDRKAMREMGKKAKEYVLENYSIDNHKDLWKEAYKTIL